MADKELNSHDLAREIEIVKLQEENKRLNGAIQTYDILLKSNAEENKQLKEKLDCDLQWAFKYEKQVDNWNKLREYLTNRYNNGTESISYRQVFLEIREMMQKLEQGSDSNE